MPSISSWLSDVSRRKLRIAASGRDGLRDTINLRRFVLLKNSITQAESPLRTSSQASCAGPNDGHTFVFPDAGAMTTSLGYSTNPSSVQDSEDKWLESVLGTLEDDFDDVVEVEVVPVEENDDILDFFESVSNDPYGPWVPPYDEFTPDPASISSDFLSTPSAVPSPQSQPPVSFQLLFDSSHSHFNQPFVEPRYPEADFDLPISETSSESDSDDDEGPLTPYSGSQPSIDEQHSAQPTVYVEDDSFFLYPSELDPISPLYYQQC